MNATVEKARYDLKGEGLVQFATPHWWAGSIWPFVKRYKSGQNNQVYRWSLWIRLPANHELAAHGAYRNRRGK